MAQLVIGFHAIEECLRGLAKSGPQSGANRLLCAGNPGPRVKQLIDLATSLGVAVVATDKPALDALSAKADHRGVILEISQGGDSLAAEPNLETFVPALIANYNHAKNQNPQARPPLILALDSITDPHNLGAILRSADKFGVDLALLPQRRSAQENETVRKSSAGASTWVNSIVVPNLHRSLLFCRDQGFWVCGADMGGQSVHNFDARLPLVLVMGSEGKGISRLLSECCDLMLNIPCTGHVDSLNVSVATGILLYELRRQQGFPW